MIVPATVPQPAQGNGTFRLYQIPVGFEGYVNAFDFLYVMDTSITSDRVIALVYATQSGQVAHTELLDEFNPSVARDRRLATYVRGPVEDDIIDLPNSTSRLAIGSLGEFRMAEKWTVGLTVYGMQALDQFQDMTITMELYDVAGPDVLPLLTPIAQDEQVMAAA